MMNSYGNKRRTPISDGGNFIRKYVVVKVQSIENHGAISEIENGIEKPQKELTRVTD